MSKKIYSILISIVMICSCSISAVAHPGRTDANGGHYNRKTGEYHYHNNGNASGGSKSSKKSSSSGKTSSGSSNKSSSSSSYSSGSAESAVNIPKEVHASKINVSNFPSSLFVGDSTQIQASVYPSNSVEQDISWESSDTSVATIDNSGNLYAVNIGTAVISASTSNGATAQLNLTVNEVVAESVVISNKASDILIGDSLQLSAVISPENTTDKSIEWQSENDEVATVDENGTLTAVSVGKTVIFAKHRELQDNFEIEVKPIEAEEINIKLYDASSNTELEEARVEIGKELSLKSVVLPDNTTDKTVEWSVDNPEIAKIEGDRLIALGVGTVKLTVAASNGVSTSLEIEVYKISPIAIIIVIFIFTAAIASLIAGAVWLIKRRKHNS